MKSFTKFLMASMTVTLLLNAGRVNALIFTEGEDASDDFNTVLGKNGIGSATEINGVVSAFGDIDLYKFVIDQTGNTTFDGMPAKDGPQLNINMFLFNDKGNPLFSVEPVATNEMKFDFVTKAGIYFLGIGSDDLDAFDAMGNPIAGNDSGVTNGNGVLSKWSAGNETTGAYRITISTVPTNAVPTPVLLPALLGFGLKALRKKKQAETWAKLPVEA
jgi:hypothetical protein